MIRDPSDGSVKAPMNGYERLKAKYGENWGIKQEGSEPPRVPFKAPTAEQLSDHYAKHNLAFQPKEQGE